LVWVTDSLGARHRGDGTLAPGVVKLLLDGQQRITSLYGIVRGHPPRFFDGNAATITGLRFHLEREEFAFYSPVHMRDDPLWIDVTLLMERGNAGLGEFVARLGADPEHASQIGSFVAHLSRILSMLEVDLHVEEVTGQDKSIDVVVDIFNRVNSGGTKLSKGDLALAKICADWPQARDSMKRALKLWETQGFYFNLDWLLRNVNTIVTGEAKFQHLHAVDAERVEDGLKRALKRIDQVLNMIGGRLGLDHDRVLSGRFAIPVMVHYLDRRGGTLDAMGRDRMLFWFVQAAMWGRFSGSTESYIDQDLGVTEELDGALDRLIEQLRLWHGGLRVEPGHFSGWSLGARFYPVLYMLTRVGGALDWGTGLPLKSNLLGRMNRLEVHHIFPRALLYKHGYKRPEVNAVANFCFLTKDTNLQISDRSPEVYFREIQGRHPEALESQWIPADPELWKVENYTGFLEARRRLLAEATNAFMVDLLHGDADLIRPSAFARAPALEGAEAVLGGVESAEEEAVLLDLNGWVEAQGLPAGRYLHELADAESGEPIAVLDVAWPGGLQEGLSEPVAVLLNEGPEVLAYASRFGFRCFTQVDDFKRYLLREVLIQESIEVAA
jgi:hypothetical protein